VPRFAWRPVSLVALEAQACGTPVVAAAVGGLVTAVADGISGVLVDGHDPATYAAVLDTIIADDEERRALSTGAVSHAAKFGWDRTVEGVLAAYAQAKVAAEEAVAGVG
jgi:D-inositol-3-phosphate glycosyltransferase